MPYKTKIATGLILFNLCLSIASAQVLLWTEIYGQQGVLEEGEDVERTYDNNYIVLEHQRLYKIDQNGDTIWTRYIGGRSIVTTQDSGFVICGSSGGNVRLLKTDGSGNILWVKFYGGPAQDWGCWVEQTSDNGFIITGETQYGGSGLDYTDIYLIKTDANGDTFWTKRFGSPYPIRDGGYAVLPTSDGGYLITGYAQEIGGQQSGRIFAIRTDSNGDTIWTRIYNYEGWGCDIKQTPDGNFIIAGRAYYSFDPQYAGLLIKINPGGNIIWSKWYPVGETGTFLPKGINLALTQDGGYFITFGDKKCRFIRTDSLGNILWSLSWGSSGWNFTAATTRGWQNNTFIATGRTDSLDNIGNGNLGIWMIGDNVGINEAQIAPSYNRDSYLKISPNPFRNAVSINFLIPGTTSQLRVPNPQNLPAYYSTTQYNGLPPILKIYDASGRLVRRWDELTTRLSDHIIWDGTDDRGIKLQSGVYFVQIEGDGFRQTKEVILLR